MGKNELAVINNEGSKTSNEYKINNKLVNKNMSFAPSFSFSPKISIQPNLNLGSNKNKSNIEKDNSEEKSSDSKDSGSKKKSPLGLFMDGFEKVSNFMAPIGKIASAGMKMTDNYINTSARLGSVNDGLQTTGQLQDKIFASAERSKGSYSTMSSAVTQLGMNAKGAFSSNDEMLAFAETVQKAFVLTGKSASDQTNGFNTLTQVMSLGKIQGKDFEQLMQKAPEVANAVASYMGKTTGELKNMDSKSAISADVIKNAMFAAGKDINGQFEKIPNTFDDLTNKSNMIQKAFEKVFEKVKAILQTSEFKDLSESISFCILFVGEVLSSLIDGFIWLGGVIQQNWSTIQPILIGLGVAIATLGILAIGQAVLMAAAWLFSMWPLVLLTALIVGIIYSVIQCGTTVETVIGFIGGIVGSLIAFIYNSFSYLANIFLSVAEFFANVWKDPIYAVQKLFYDLSINVLSFLTNIALGIENILSHIPGFKVNISGNMSNLLKDLEKNRDNLKSEKDVIHLTRFGQKDYGEAFTSGEKIGESAFEATKKSFANLKNINMSNLDSIINAGAATYTPSIDSINQPVQVVGKNSDNLNVDMSQEDLKYLRDIAEREYINNFSTATLAPNVSITFGDVNKEADVDQVASRIQRILQEQIAVVAEGAY